MDPTSKKKIGSLLEALEIVNNRFNLKQLENEIVEILSPNKSETSKKKESLYETPSTSKYDPGFSFVRHQQDFIPGLSIPQEAVPQEKPSNRSGFGDGKFESQIMPGISFGSKEKPLTDAFRTFDSFRGRGANFSAPRRYEKFKPYVKEEIPSSSSALSDNRVPKPEPGPFAERKISQVDDRDPRAGHKTEDTKVTHDRSLDEPNRSFNSQMRGSSEQQRYPDRGGTSCNNRGYENRGRGVDRGRVGWHDNRGGRGFNSNRGRDNKGASPSGSNRGQDNRGRPFNNYRGPNNRGQGNDHRGGRRGRRRAKMSLEEQEKRAAEMDKRNAEIFKQMRLRAGLSVEDEAENK